MERVLRKLYLNPNSSSYLAGINTLYREAKKEIPSIRVKDIENFLHKQDVYTLHKPVKRRFPRNRVVPSGYDSDWQADMVDLRSMAKYNKQHTFLLTVIDVLSKYGWAVPVKNKKPETVAVAFEQILKSSGRKCWRLMTDKGREFSGKPFQELMKKYDIHFFTANSPDVKAPNVERFNRTLKAKLWKHFTLKHTFHYLDVLPKIVDGINRTVSTVTKKAPVDVTPANEREVWHVAYGDGSILPKVPFKLKLNETVRISKEKGKFTKGYMPNFQEELFVVHERLARNPPVYRLRDMHGTVIEGIFYNSELSRVKGKGI